MKRILLSLALFMAAPILLAKVARISFEKMVLNSDVIVVAKVDKIAKRWWSPFGTSYASARIIERWKAPTSLTGVEFVAPPTWTCDISTATVNETVVLFLRRNGDAYEIVHSGRGRLPVRTEAGEQVATIWTGDVTLPASLKPQPGTKKEYDFIQSVKVTELRAAVADHLRRAAN